VQISLENRQTIVKHATPDNGKFGSCGSDYKFGSSGSSAGKYLALAALSANSCRQIFGSCGSVGKHVAPPANLDFAVAWSANSWLRRQIWLLRKLCWQIFGSGSSVGNHFAPAANLASRQLSRQLFGYFGKDLAPPANIWLQRLCRQSCRSGGISGFLAAQSAAQSAIVLAPWANIWLFGSAGSSVGKELAPLVN
jgi:hypothetical protein